MNALSHITYLYALLTPTPPHAYAHFFGDGRDTALRSAAGYCAGQLAFMQTEKYGALATRREWVKVTVDGLVGGVDQGSDHATVADATKDSFERAVTGEFMWPIIANGMHGTSRVYGATLDLQLPLRQHAQADTVLGLPPPRSAHGLISPEGSATIPSAAFPPQAITNVPAKWLAADGVDEAHIAETEKPKTRHILLQRLRRKQFAHEERLMVRSPKYALASEENKAEDDGASALCDVAPTVLDLLTGG
ncbi:hypothetical protein C8J57DRAFT_1493876 [Mycena rebaudengoi]|nr:hypothetical protein C8J57DRAFT_1493876 [Mycena rebaudengoi]